MVIVVYGFPSRLAALQVHSPLIGTMIILQFEWAWQNPHKSRHFKIPDNEIKFSGTRKEKYLSYKLEALARMFHLEHYKRWPLHLHFTSDFVYAKFKTLKDLPPHVRVTTGSLRTIPFEDYMQQSTEGSNINFYCYS